MTSLYSKVRVASVLIFFTMIFVLFAARLIFIQVIRGDEFRDKAKRQYLAGVELPAPRGEIVDAKGNKIAANSCFKSLCLYALTDEDLAKSYTQIARIIGESESHLRSDLKLTDKKFYWIKRGLSLDEAGRCDSSSYACGLFVREEPTRSYPYGDIGRGILGFVDLDNRGKSGVEMAFDDRLTGISGRSLIQKDGKGKEYHISEFPLQEAVPGRSIMLTVDWDKQQVVEEELINAVKQYKARAGAAVFIDIRTGGIIAAADYDTIDGLQDKPMKLGAIANVYEPGSAFKIVTAAAALESGRVSPSDSVYAENGLWRLGKHSLRDDHKFGWLTFRKAFENSSNIGIGKIANRTDPDRVFDMAEKLGFGRKTRCGLQGEVKGALVRPRQWSTYTASAFAIGHGLSVTPLQMAQAFAIIASGGYFIPPYFVKGFIDPDGQVDFRHSKPVRILSEKTCRTLDEFMQGVVERGTAKPIADAPFKIAGKTGTAQVPDFQHGGYLQHKFMASFGGYFPADSPLVAGIVVLDEPEPIHYGGYTSAPTFKNIAIKFASIDKYDIRAGRGYKVDSTKSDTIHESTGISFVSAKAYDSPSETPEPDITATVKDIEYVTVPDLIGLSRAEARNQLHRAGFDVAFTGAGDSVLLTRPSGMNRIPEGGMVMCYMTPAFGGAGETPDVMGLTVREAVAILDRYGISYACEGTGRAVIQYPLAGSRLSPGETVKVIFDKNGGA